MKAFSFLSLALIATVASASFSEPYPVLLPVGQERRLEIEGAREIRVGVPQTLQKQLRVESAGAFVWLTAAQELTPQRLYLETDAGSLILEVRTDAQVAATPLRINPEGGTPHAVTAPEVGYVALTRYAVQSLYAPEAHIEPIPGIRPAPAPRDPVALFRCRAPYPSACGDAVEALPHSAWKFGPHYLIALTVRNQLAQPLQLDPRDVRGRIVTSSIVHPQLGAAGSPQDTTAVILISSVPPEHVW